MAERAFGGLTNEQAVAMLLADMQVALNDVIDIIRAAKEAGYFINYSTGEIDGRQQITTLNVVKRF